MKFKTKEQKVFDLRNKSWHKWFAIIPVKIKTNDERYMWVCLRYVWRKFINITHDIEGCTYNFKYKEK